VPEAHNFGDVSVEVYRFEDDGQIPNNPELPALVYRGAFRRADDLALALERRFAENGWTAAWRDIVFDFHHYHSTAHEVLGVFQGEARLRLGGERGRSVKVEPGDVVVIPAGVGHRAENWTEDLQVVVATAGGREWDICKGEPGERPRVLQSIAQVPRPDGDPREAPTARSCATGADRAGVALWPAPGRLPPNLADRS